MSFLPPKRKSKELEHADLLSFRLLVYSSRPEFWAVDEKERERRNKVLDAELALIEEYFNRVAGIDKRFTCPICSGHCRNLGVEQFGDIPVTNVECIECGHKFIMQGEYSPDDVAAWKRGDPDPSN